MLKPWYKIITPREDLREGRPLDAAEFAVHLDQIRDGRAITTYQDPKQFFERTYLTKNLIDLAAEVVRRLSGEKTETSAIFNMSTQFGGGKTHALTLLYHLAVQGHKSSSLIGVNKILSEAKIKSVPQALVAVFVGTEFDSLNGRGGENGEPLRKTPWGEIAYQIGGKESFKLLEEHENQMTAPAGDVIRKFLPEDKPVLILMDEIMNYISRSRKSGMSDQFYNFIHNLSEVVRGRDNVVFVVSIPASELEMTTEDQSDYERIKKILNRLGKAVVMSEKYDIAEIIRRRLFEWDMNAVSQAGKVMLTKDAEEVCKINAEWVIKNRHQLSHEFPVDSAIEEFKSSYPFHPTIISVFERKWQSLPRFQQTRGVLRLLALWVSKAYQDGYKGNHKDSLITLGTAPLDDSLFRAATLEQLGESRLEGVITTDICGKNDSHAVRLDNDAIDIIKHDRLHKKVATSIFFESNGGQARASASLAEIRLGVGGPNVDIGNIETAVTSLLDGCFYLDSTHSAYHFRITPNINKILVDRKATINNDLIMEKCRNEVKKIFATHITNQYDLIYYPKQSSQIPDKPIVTFVILSPDHPIDDGMSTFHMIEQMTKEYGSSSRCYKNALIWCTLESNSVMIEEARKLLAWESIYEDDGDIGLDDKQLAKVTNNLKRSERDLRESVWRSYKILFLLERNGSLKKIDLGLPHSSAAETMLSFIITKLRQEDEIGNGVSPSFLVRNWPPAFIEWGIKNLRDAFYASPVFPRLMNYESIKETIKRGVQNGEFAYVGKLDNLYKPFYYKQDINESIEFTDDMYIITAQKAEEYLQMQKIQKTPEQTAIGTVSEKQEQPEQNNPKTKNDFTQTKISTLEVSNKLVKKVSWIGIIPHLKWTNFYMRVLSKIAQDNNLKLKLEMEISPEIGVTKNKIEEIQSSLRELGIEGEFKIEN